MTGSRRSASADFELPDKPAAAAVASRLVLEEFHLPNDKAREFEAGSSAYCLSHNPLVGEER